MNSPTSPDRAATPTPPDTSHEVKSRLWSNAISNYVRAAIAISVGLVTFRILYQALPPEPFGFWCLLWSVFGYGVLLDGGFGFAAQKRVAELSVTRDWPQLSRVLSTILSFYVLIAIALALFVFAFAPHIITWLGVAPQHRSDFQPIMVVFFAAIALSFPMGIFTEILRGQQRIRLVNTIVSLCILSRLGLIIAAAYYHWSFMAFMLIAIGFTLAPDCIAAFFALRQLPEVQLRPRHCSWAIMRHTASFSVFAYIGTATNLILGKSDQLLLGATLGLSAIATYQAGAKIAEVFAQFTLQVQDTLTPAAAHLHASGQTQALRDLLRQGIRWSLLIAAPLYLLCAFHLQPLLAVLTGNSSLPAETYLVGHIMLLWHLSSIITHSVTKRIFMMSGHERRLMWLGLSEALLNIVLSLTLTLLTHSVVGTALGSLLACAFFGWVYCWPWAAREAQLTSRQLIRAAVFPALRASAPLLAFLCLLKGLPTPASPWVALLFHGGLAAAVGAFSLWRYGLNAGERATLQRRLPSFLRTSPPPSQEPALA